MKVRFMIIAIAVAVLVPFICCYTAAIPDIDTESAILVDFETGQVLFEKDADREKTFPASTTKIMTAILALENGEPIQIMTASQAAVNDIGKDGMNIGIMAGEELRLYDLLNAMLVRSANETANIIAENICSSRQEFIDLMNIRAEELGAVNTNFMNPCGAHNENHYTTARDMAIIARHAMSIPEFREIVARKEYNMPPTNKHDTWGIPLYTTNKLLSADTGDLYNITGIKTGYTAPAGFCLVSSAQNDKDTELISVVFGVKNEKASENVYLYSKQLLEYGFNNFTNQTLVIPHEVIKEAVPVANSKNDVTINLIASDHLSCLLPVDKEEWNLNTTEFIHDNIEAPLNRGDELGYIEYSRNGVTLGRVGLVSSTSVEKYEEPAAFEKVVNTESDNPVLIIALKVCLLAVILFFILRIIMKSISRKVNKRRKNHI
jgi:serine-type D-Ala-D-Ala carboxypeptidase (penicillin-binding protein 5/6)